MGLVLMVLRPTPLGSQEKRAMTIRPTTIERAFELAQSGRYLKLQEIKRQLKAEGYADVDGQLYGLSLRKQLERISGEARNGGTSELGRSVPPAE